MDFFGTIKRMRRRLRIDVAESEHQIVFINDLGRDFAGDDFFKKGLAHSFEF